MIPGLCRIWARKLTSDTKEYWFKMPYAPRGYTECESLIDYYQEHWGQLYQYQITPDLDLCKPLA